MTVQLMQICLEVEETLAKIYRRLAEHGPGDETLRQLWRQLAADEDQHAQQIRFLLRLPREGVVKGENLPLATATAMRDYAKKALKEITDKAISEATALQLARKLERDFGQVHATVAMEYQQEQTRSMFAALARADQNHERLLAAFYSNAAHQSG